jgi:hypothetical protein
VDVAGGGERRSDRSGFRCAASGLCAAMALPDWRLDLDRLRGARLVGAFLLSSVMT